MKRIILFLFALISIVQIHAQEIGTGKTAATNSDMTEGTATFSNTCSNKYRTFRAYKYTRIFKGAYVTGDDLYTDTHGAVENWRVKDYNGSSYNYKEPVKVTNSGSIEMAMDPHCAGWRTVLFTFTVIDITFQGMPSTMCETDSRIDLNNYTNLTGASFSGNGVVSNRYFDPSLAGEGSHTITLTAWDERLTQTITVKAEPNLTSSLLPEVNNNDGVIDLSREFAPTGGTFAVKVGSTPIPLEYGKKLDLLDVIPSTDYTTTSKNVTITYTHDNGACLTTKTQILKVNNNNVKITFNDLPDLCLDGDELDLSNYVTPQGGEFSASGVSIYGGSLLQPSRVGVFEIKYTVEQDGAKTTVSKYVRINDLPYIDFAYPPDVCSTANINLNNYVSPTGGTFSGPGVTGTTFNPSTAGIGTHNVTYTFTDANGCAYSETRNIDVVELMPTNVVFSSIPNVCVEGSTIYLPDHINHSGGVFSGNGVTGDYFNPLSAGAGSHLVKYKVTTGKCKLEYSTTITVQPEPSVTFNSLPPVCNKKSEINLSAYVSVTGGTFSGTGVVSNKFYGDIAGIGEHNIYYNYTDGNGCTTSEQQTIRVDGQIPDDLVFNSIPATCEQGTVIELTDYVNYIEGTFSGKGVTGSLFDPASAGAGVHKITYRYFSGSCTETKERTINVQPATAVSFYNIPTVCYKTPINLSGYVSHTGGSFSGKGVSGNFFYPENAGLGQHIITYRYSNGLGCETIITKTIEIDLLVDETVAFNSINDKCINSPSVYLRSFINTSEGTFSGPGVTGDYFNPADAGVGTWTVKWSNQNGGCNQELTTVINVSNEPAVLFNPLPNVCYAGETVILENFVSHKGGNFNGPGVVSGIFNADQAGEGTHTINYTYRDGDCEVTKSQTIFVKGLLTQNAVFSAVPNICVTGSVVDLQPYVNISGGVFSGRGITGTLFDPAVAGTGVTEITYTLTSGGCEEELKQTITIESNTNVSFYDLGIICNAETKNLNGFVSHTGGTFNGPGVSGTTFDPASAGVGSHIITYTYQNASGCETIINKTVSVDLLLPEITWSALPDLCQNSTAIYLPDYINHAGGTFSGIGVSGSYFNPSVAGTGIFTIKYTAQGGRCSQEYTTSIQVSEGTNVTFNTIPSICFNEKIDLNSFVSHTGGSFTGVGVSGNMFDPAVAGRGSYTITYTYNNLLGCETSLTQTISVIDLLEGVNFNALPVVCESSTPVILDSYITNHSTGTFSGPGVTGNVFDPSRAGAGIHLLKYTINNGGCFIELKQNVTVHPKVDVTFSPQNDVCYDQSFDIAFKVSPSGGVFSGPGMSGTTFDPASAGVGSHVITYTYTSVNGCETKATQIFNVVDLIDINIAFDPMPEVCVEAGTVYLPDFMNHTGGSFSGKGVNGNYFNPAIAGEGTHMVTYTVTAGSCVISVTDVINVFSSDQIVFSSIPKQCYDAPVNLADYVSPQGGTFSGSGVVNNQFLPGNVGLGTYTLTYEYTNEKGCKGTATQTVEVVDLMSADITFSTLPEVCPESSVINLRNYVNSVEGTFKGNGVTGEYFDPASAGAGVHKILFQIINGTCKIERYQSIIVKSPPSLSFEELPNVCNPDLIDLSSFVLPKGGVFSGNGVGGNVFDPSVAGIGDHTINYMLTDENGCTNTISQVVSVNDVIPSSISFNTLAKVCSNGSSVRLSDHIINYQPAGEFSGNGVSGEWFNPSLAGIGIHNITYTVGNGNCEIEVSQDIEVVGSDSNIQFHTLPVVCQASPVNLRNYTTKDGTFSGPGVSGGVFNPATAGLGEHTISFSVLNSLGCEYVMTQTVEVVDLLPSEITFSALPDRCQSGTSIKLSDFTNAEGTFSGTGVDGEFFNPSTVAPGTYTIRFTFSSGKCESSLRQVVTVIGEEEIYINPLPELCNKDVINLDQYVTVQGGVWTGVGVSNNKFYPENAGLGAHVLTYTYTNSNNCKTIIQETITVNELLVGGVTFNVIDDLCEDSSPINLNDFVTSGVSGKFTGTGVEGNYFSPSISGPGAFVINFEIGSTTSCKKSFTQTVVVHSKEEVVFSAVPDKCDNLAIDLNNYVSHTGGIFTGVGMSGTTFNPSVAGQGEHLITYNYENLAGCKTVVTQTITVPRIYPSISFNPLSEVCENSTTINLLESVNFAGGIFAGNGVEGNVFNPSVAGAGSHLITYTVGNDECKILSEQTITVVGVPDIEFTALPDVCLNTPVNLNDYVNVQDGSFSGNGVNGSLFDPALAGLGEHIITFHYSSNGCSKEVKASISVLSLINPNFTFDPIQPMCEDAAAVDLGLYTNVGANFSGPGVTGNLFYPSVAGSGTHEVIMQVGNGSCSKEIRQYITVYGKTELSLSPIPEICNGESINLNDYVNVIGGSFDGENVSANYFYPQAIGDFPITYTYTNRNGCVNSVKFIVTVSGMYPEAIMFNQVDDLCSGASIIDLRNYTDYYGEETTFSGNGVVGYLFDPIIAGVGIHQITMTNGSGTCQTSKVQYVTINDNTPITFSLPSKLCKDETIDLEQYINVSGGTFTGDGVANNQLKTSSAGLGEHVLTYTFVNAEGCETVISKTVSIEALNKSDITFNTLDEVCENGSTINLQNYVNETTNVTFYGNGVTGYMFNPENAGAGTHVITLKVGLTGGCIDEYKQNINVLPLPEVQFSALPEVCFVGEINLLEYVNNESGFFEGPGVIGTTFNPEKAGTGVHKITYYVVDSYGCYTIKTNTIEVKTLYPSNVKFSTLPIICAEDEAIFLSDYVDFSIGTFSGTGVTNSMFYPSVAGPGTHAVNYTIGVGGCAQTITQYVTVFPQTTIEFLELPEVCEAVVIDLNEYVNISGGDFEGVGVENGLINTDGLAVGNYPITYHYFDSNGCNNSSTQTLTINGSLESNVEFSPLPTLCESANIIYLTDYVDIKTGNFKGEGVRNSVFDPADAKAGTHKITYTLSNGKCEKEFSQYITVVPSQKVTFGSLPEICNDVVIDLENYVTPKGGTFEGINVNGTTINTADMIPDVYEITYIFNDANGCEVRANQTLSIEGHLPDGVEFTELPPLCENAEPIYLTDYVNNITGNFSGEGVRNSLFDPADAKAGTHRITYRIEEGTCVAKYTQFITVYPQRKIVFNDLPEICEAQLLNLSPYVSVEGGAFSGQAVSGTMVNTELLPIGDHVITYTFTDNNGCKTEVSNTLTIAGNNPKEGTVVFDTFESICVNSSPVELTNYINHSGGSFGGNGVTGTVFNPKDAGFGIHLISYTYGEGSCSVTITESIEVKDAPEIVFHDIPSLCYIDDEINLANYVSVRGGTFTGVGIEGAILKRSNLEVGIYTITYSYDTANGCTINLNKTITIEDALPETVTFSKPAEICVNGDKVNLYQFVNTNGMFTGTGVESDGLFNPYVAGVGEHRISFKYGNGDCETEIHQFINVTDSKNIEFSSFGKVCNTEPVILSDYVNYKGGTFEGRGVTDGVFYPDMVGEGIHSITYTFSDGLCTVVASQNIEVLSAGTIEINIDRSSVESSALIKLWSEGAEITNYRWDFGDGGYSTEKEPFHYYYHEGDFDVRLRCEDTKGCRYDITKEKFITVVPYNSALKSVVVVNDPTAKVGIHYEDEEKVETKAYPNPFYHEFTVQIGNDNVSEVRVINATGRLVKSVNVGDSDTEVTVPMHEEKPGLYFVQVGNEVLKLIKK